MSKFAIANRNVPFAFNGVDIVHVEKGEEFEGDEGQLLVDFGFAAWQEGERQGNGDDPLTIEQLTANLEEAQKKLKASRAQDKSQLEQAVKQAEDALAAALGG